MEQKDGKGKIIGDAKADYREPGITDGNSHGNTPRNQGRILTGNEYLTCIQRRDRRSDENN